jgi:hypothetical protein
VLRRRVLTAVACFLAFAAGAAGPAPAAPAPTGLALVEPDARTVPWSTLDRLLLQGGVFLPAHRPVSEDELRSLIDSALAREAAGRAAWSAADRALLLWWRDRFVTGGRAPRWRGCPCKEHPPEARLTGRVLAGWQELGDPLSGEAGLSWAAGTNLAAEAGADGSLGSRWWYGVSVRGSGRVAGGGALAADDPLAWPGWPLATGRATVGAARRQGGAWTVDVPRAVVGARLGRWALSVGWEPRRVGPGLDGGLTLDTGGASFAALTARRTAPFRWRGIMKPLAPSELLLRAGLLSERTVRFATLEGPITTFQHPWFMEWQVGWRPTSWSRFTATHAVMAASQDGTLWPDILQINFPVIGTTWKETFSGPVTDRLFAVGMEARWRDAPWPVLPSAAGRVWWEYGGTDFLPSGPFGVVPQISIPASVAGVMFVDPGWDLALEYAELRHVSGLWYSNSGFPEGFTHEQWLLAHELGGSGESAAVGVKVRPGGALEAGLKAGWARWGLEPRTPGEGERWSLSASLGRLPAAGSRTPLLWTVRAEMRREEARRPAADPVRRTWGRVWLELTLP